MLSVRGFWKPAGFFKYEFGFAVRMVKTAIFKEPALDWGLQVGMRRRCSGVFVRPGPLDAAALLDHLVIANAGDVARFGGNDPQSADAALANALYDLVLSPTGLHWDESLGHAQRGADLQAMSQIGELVAADKIGDVRNEPRTHGIALARDAVGAGD